MRENVSVVSKCQQIQTWIKFPPSDSLSPVTSAFVWSEEVVKPRASCNSNGPDWICAKCISILQLIPPCNTASHVHIKGVHAQLLAIDC